MPKSDTMVDSPNDINAVDTTEGDSSNAATSAASNIADVQTTNESTSNTNINSRAPSKSLSSREQLQIQKLRKANEKYKSLLKMAKARIEAQEEELGELQEEISTIKKTSELSSSSSRPASPSNESSPNTNAPPTNDENDTSILKVWQRIKMETHDQITGTMSEPASSIEIWALMEYEVTSPDTGETLSNFKKWNKFSSESSLDDFIRRDTGEPLVLPPYSLTPEQSHKVEEDAKKDMEYITEEFRRFRVKAEVARKQSDATVRALHCSNAKSTKKKIEEKDLENELLRALTENAQLETLKRELTEQEDHWKQAYETLRAENLALKSSGAEALLAAQWRQRYETLLKEKEDLELRSAVMKDKLDVLMEKSKIVDAGRYEMKYREVKVAFKSYRKKAKEIFEDMQKGDNGLLTLSDRITEDAKLQYIRNLMVNYLSADPAVREHMELAIGTVLKFSLEEKEKIEKRKLVIDAAWMPTFMNNGSS